MLRSRSIFTAVSHHHLDQSVNLHTVIDQHSFSISISFQLYPFHPTSYKMYPLPPQVQVQAQYTAPHAQSQPRPQIQSQSQSQIQTIQNINQNTNANSNPTKTRPSASCIPCRNRKVKVPPPPSTPSQTTFNTRYKKTQSKYKLIKTVQPLSPLQHMSFPRPSRTMHLHNDRQRPHRHEIGRDNRGLAPENPRPQDADFRLRKLRK